MGCDWISWTRCHDVHVVCRGVRLIVAMHRILFGSNGQVVERSCPQDKTRLLHQLVHCRQPILLMPQTTITHRSFCIHSALCCTLNLPICIGLLIGLCFVDNCISLEHVCWLLMMGKGK